MVCWTKILISFIVPVIQHGRQGLCHLNLSGMVANNLSRNERRLEHSTQFMTMTYDPKKYNPSSCVAGRITNFPSSVARRPLCHLNMNCDRMTNFPSCVARRLLHLCHLIMNCDHNKTLSSYEAHICVEHLHQIRGDEVIKYNRSIVQSSKSNSGNILLYYESKSRRAQSSAQISINDSSRCNYARKSYKRYQWYSCKNW